MHGTEIFTKFTHDGLVLYKILGNHLCCNRLH